SLLRRRDEYGDAPRRLPRGLFDRVPDGTDHPARRRADELALAHDDLAARDRGHGLTFGAVAIERPEIVLPVEACFLDHARPLARPRTSAVPCPGSRTGGFIRRRDLSVRMSSAVRKQ